MDVGKAVEVQGTVHLGQLFMSIVGSEKDYLQPHRLCETNSAAIPTLTSSKAGEAEPAGGGKVVSLPIMACITRIRRHSGDAKSNADPHEPLQMVIPGTNGGLRPSQLLS